MKIKKLIENLDIIEQHIAEDIEIDSIVYDSRKARQGSIFVCIEGYITDGHKYIAEAVKQGAAAIVIQNQSAETLAQLDGVNWLYCLNTRKVLAQLSATFFKNPSTHLKLIGITGTKGKTTTSYMLREILKAAGQKTGLIGTVAYMIQDQITYASRTTPESYDLQMLLADMVAQEVDSCVMEVSSQGLKLDRVYACHYHIGAFTNFYKDHIGSHEHPDMADYFASKLRLFPMAEKIVVNKDIPQYDDLIKHAHEPCVSYSLLGDADIKVKSYHPEKQGERVGSKLVLQGEVYQGDLFVAMPGMFNIYNALCAISIASMLEIPFAAVQTALANISVPGRVQPIPNRHGKQVIVDYAHNAESLEQLLETLRSYCQGRLIVVFGCGGNRAKARRYEMGAVAAKLADFTIITTDNPRNEEPIAIIEDILVGFGEKSAHKVIVERKDAIREAIEMATVNDLVVIAGKGHENYQIYKNETIHFDDAEVAAEILAEE